MNIQPNHLPPRPQRLDVFRALIVLGAALLGHDSLMYLWGIDPAWPWFPHTAVGAVLLLALGYFRWPLREISSGPFAPPTTRRKLLVGMAFIAIFAVVITPSVLLG